MGPTINISSWMTVKSKEICFKNIYRRRKNIALPFHFAIVGICRQLLNSIDLVFHCAWQKVETNLWVIEGGHWKRSWGLQPNKESNKTPQKSRFYS